MEKFVATRKAYESHNTRIRNKLDKEIKQGTNIANLRILLEKLEVREDKINDINQKILSETDPKDIEREIATQEESLDQIIDMKMECKLLIEKLTSEQQNKSKQTLPVSVKAKVKLPRIEIKKFKGQIENYPEFRDTYIATIDSNKELEEVEKFFYLKSYLEGDAENLIAGFSTTNENYKKAMHLLEETYGRKSVIINLHVSKLINLDKQKKGEVKSLRKLYNEVTIHVRALEALEIHPDQYSIFLVPIVLSKVNEDINIDWAKTKSESNIDVLLEFLKVQVESEENASQVKAAFETKPESINIDKESRYKDSRRYQNTGYNSTAAALQVYTQEKRCIFCPNKSNHQTEECKATQKLTNEEIRNILSRENVCFCCMKKNHRIKDCRKLMYLKCKRCGSNKHHTILHSDKIEHGQSALVVRVETNERKIIMQTTQANLRGIDNKIVKVRVLLDTGSERSFITKQVAQQLSLESHVENLAVNSFGGNEDSIKKGK